MTHPIMVLAVSMGLAASPQSSTQVAANSVDAGAPHASRSVGTTQAKPAAPEKTYCTSGTISGSRIVKQECKTKAEWAKEGVDINDLMNGQE
jgi:hypothetical protein